MQANFSHGRGLCAEYGGLCPEGLTMEQVISAWMDAIAPISRNDAAAMCVPAVIVAASGTR